MTTTSRAVCLNRISMSDLVMVEREVLERAHEALSCCYDVNDWPADGTTRQDAALRLLTSALQSVEGGVQGSIATKQESCPESAPRTETAVREILLRLRATATEQLGNTYALLSSPPKSDAAWQIRNAIDKELARIDAVSSGVTNSAPASRASHNSGERDPVVMPDCPGADTKSDGGEPMPERTQARLAGSDDGLGPMQAIPRTPGDCSGPSDAQLTKTPSADHDAGNLRSLADRLEDFLRVLESARRSQNKAISVWSDDVVIVASAVNALRLAEPNHQPHALSQATSPELLALIERAKSHVMTPEERYEQRRSFVRGMCPSSRDYSSWCAEVDKLLPPLPAPPPPENTPRDSSESTTGGTAPDHTTIEERGR